MHKTLTAATRRRAAPMLLASLALAACGGGGGAGPTERAQGASACDTRSNDSIGKLLECVTLEGVREHQAALQAIADANGGTRASGTPGYDQSLAYVVERLSAAGYQVTLNGFAFVYVPPTLLQQTAPTSAVHPSGSMTGTGYGDVSAGITPVDLSLGLGNASTSGCEAADFTGFPAGHIALIQRGSCAFSVKAQHAEAAGASAVIFFNQGNTTETERQDVFSGTLTTITVGIPLVTTSYGIGVQLAQAGSAARVKVDPPTESTQYNVIAESRLGDASNVVMAGAHLDSVQAGPGINANGSGAAALIDVAEQLARIKPRNQLRFAWWAASESGLVGSTAYVDGLSDADRSRIALYMNFDMVGSPNHVFFIYDGDDSDGVGSGAGPAGSAAIEATFERYYRERGFPFKGTDFSGRSDYGPFIAVGIPSGGLFTGAEGIKTAEEAALWGGTAGQPYDPCYRQACDTFANNSDTALDLNADAIAYATLKYAMTTEDVNRQKSKGKFKKLVVPYPPPPAM